MSQVSVPDGVFSDIPDPQTNYNIEGPGDNTPFGSFSDGSVESIANSAINSATSSFSGPDSSVSHYDLPASEFDVFEEPTLILSSGRHDLAAAMVRKYHHILLAYSHHMMPQEVAPLDHLVPDCTGWPSTLFYKVFTNYRNFCSLRMAEYPEHGWIWTRWLDGSQEARLAMVMTSPSESQAGMVETSIFGCIYRNQEGYRVDAEGRISRRILHDQSQGIVEVFQEWFMTEEELRQARSGGVSR